MNADIRTLLIGVLSGLISGVILTIASYCLFRFKTKKTACNAFNPQGERCLITVPIVETNRNNNGNNKPSHLYKDAPLAVSIYNLLLKIRDASQITLFRNKDEVSYGTEIHIGTPAVSIPIRKYVLGLRKQKDFIWCITQEHFNENFNQKDFTELEYNEFVRIDYKVDGKFFEGFMFGTHVYKFEQGKEDWAFILRKTEGSKTIHIFFSIGSNGRRFAVKHFSEHFKEINKEHGTNNYLLVAQVKYDEKEEKWEVTRKFENIMNLV